MSDGAPAEGEQPAAGARVSDDGGPILAPRGASAALASNPRRELDHSYHAYESNPAPWWMAIVWLAFLVGGALYLVRNLMQ